MEKVKINIVFIIDEFPQLVSNIFSSRGEEAAKSFLAWFRSIRMRQKNELRRFRYIVGGSTGIDIILRRLQASDKLNDFFRLPVEPLKRADAERIIHGLAEEYDLDFSSEAIDMIIIHGLAEEYDLDFSSEAIDMIFELIGPPVPYFIHLLVSQIMLETDLTGKALSPEDVKNVYHKRLLGPTCRSYFEFYRQRLKNYGGPAERAAVAVLQKIAATPTGRVAESQLFETYKKTRKKGRSDMEFREIMADLECDWYISLDTKTNEYFFLMEIMKAWWNRFYRSIYKPKK
jgi:hypothetical protein